MLDLSVQMDALCYPFKRPIVIFSLKTFEITFLIIFNDGRHELRYSSFILGKVIVSDLKDLWPFLEKS